MSKNNALHSVTPMSNQTFQETFDVEFDPAGENFMCCGLCFDFCCSCIGILCVPCTPCFAAKIWQGQSCKVDRARINYKSGWLNKNDKTIPLDRIQDININQTWVMRCFGISNVNLETAGSGNPDGAPEAVLIAVKDPLSLRNELIHRRDEIVLHGNAGPRPGGSGVDPGIINKQPGKIPEMDIGAQGLRELIEIRKTLERIEQKGKM